MKLSKNFVLSELTKSNTAKRLGIKNEPTKEHMDNLQVLVRDLIQPIRDGIGPIRVSSGYRNPELNRAIGGSRNEFDFAWIHISLKGEDNRKQVLEAYKDEEGDTKYKYADAR